MHIYSVHESSSSFAWNFFRACLLIVSRLLCMCWDTDVANCMNHDARSETKQVNDEHCKGQMGTGQLEIALHKVFCSASTLFDFVEWFAVLFWAILPANLCTAIALHFGKELFGDCQELANHCAESALPTLSPITESGWLDVSIGHDWYLSFSQHILTTFSTISFTENAFAHDNWQPPVAEPNYSVRNMKNIYSSSTFNFGAVNHFTIL